MNDIKTKYKEPLEYEKHYSAKTPENIEKIINAILKNPIPFKEVNLKEVKILGIDKKIVTCGCGATEGEQLFIVSPSLDQRITYEPKNKKEKKRFEYDLAYHKNFITERKKGEEKIGFIKRKILKKTPKKFDYLTYSTLVNRCNHVEHVKKRKKTERIATEQKVYPIYDSQQAELINKHFFKIRNLVDVHYETLEEKITTYAAITGAVLGGVTSATHLYSTPIPPDSGVDKLEAYLFVYPLFTAIGAVLCGVISTLISLPPSILYTSVMKRIRKNKFNFSSNSQHYYHPEQLT